MARRGQALSLIAIEQTAVSRLELSEAEVEWGRTGPFDDDAIKASACLVPPMQTATTNVTSLPQQSPLRVLDSAVQHMCLLPHHARPFRTTQAWRPDSVLQRSTRVQSDGVFFRTTTPSSTTRDVFATHVGQSTRPHARGPPASPPHRPLSSLN